MTRVGPIIIRSPKATGITNIREMVGDINRCVHRIKSAGDERIAEILTEIGQGILADPRLDNQTRQETIENLRTLAWEASIPSAQRQLGVVKAALAYIPSLLRMSPDVLNYFHLRDLRRFFGIPG